MTIPKSGGMHCATVSISIFHSSTIYTIRRFLVALEQVTQYILRWEPFKYFFTDNNILKKQLHNHKIVLQMFFILIRNPIDAKQ